MSKYKMDLNLFALPIKETIKEMRKESECMKSSVPWEWMQAIYIKGIEDHLDEMLRKTEEDDFLHALQGVHFMSTDLEKMVERQESIDADLKGVIKKLDGIEKALHLIAGRIG